mmetsp:Transcript_23244/g.53773  ORF Transcript_23244/g.53773 Transcript_23244/m.53773 type:complete len:270 (-) Transcript_23244:419-1228(-)
MCAPAGPISFVTASLGIVIVFSTRVASVTGVIAPDREPKTCMLDAAPEPRAYVDAVVCCGGAAVAPSACALASTSRTIKMAISTCCSVPSKRISCCPGLPGTDISRSVLMRQPDAERMCLIVIPCAPIIRVIISRGTASDFCIVSRLPLPSSCATVRMLGVCCCCAAGVEESVGVVAEVDTPLFASMSCTIATAISTCALVPSKRTVWCPGMPGTVELRSVFTRAPEAALICLMFAPWTPIMRVTASIGKTSCFSTSPLSASCVQGAAG